MPNVTFKSDNKTEQAQQGEPLMNVADRTKASIPFGCRNGICGTCIMKVNKGMENLSAPEEKEKNTLQMFGAGPQNRLTCQCKVNGDVEIENL
jgi:ferredoxin